MLTYERYELIFNIRIGQLNYYCKDANVIIKLPHYLVANTDTY